MRSTILIFSGIVLFLVSLGVNLSAPNHIMDLSELMAPKQLMAPWNLSSPDSIQENGDNQTAGLYRITWDRWVLLIGCFLGIVTTTIGLVDRFGPRVRRIFRK